MPRRGARRIVRTAAVEQSAAAKTVNFVVHGLDSETNRIVAEAAERERHEQAEFWFGQPMPRWTNPAQITVRWWQRTPEMTKDTGGGATSFARDGNAVWDWSGTWVATSREFFVKSIVPHEVSHMVWQSHWDKNEATAPRWLDEGIAEMMELDTDTSIRISRRVLGSREEIDQAQLHAILRTFKYDQYSSDSYSVGHAVCMKLFTDHGKKRFVTFADDVASGKRERGFLGLGYSSSRSFALNFRMPKLSFLKRECRCRTGRTTTPPANGPTPADITASAESVPPNNPARARWVPAERRLHFEIPRGEKGEKGDKGDTGPAGKMADLAALEAEVSALRKRLDNFTVEVPIEVLPERK